MTNINPVVFQEDSEDGIGCVPTGVKLIPIVSKYLFPFQINMNLDSDGESADPAEVTLIDKSNTGTPLTAMVLDHRKVTFTKRYEGVSLTATTNTGPSLSGETNGYGFSIDDDSPSFRYVEFKMQGVRGITASDFTLDILAGKGGSVLISASTSAVLYINQPKRVVFDLGSTYDNVAQDNLYVRVKSNSGKFRLVGSDRASYDAIPATQSQERYFTAEDEWSDASASDQSHGEIRVYEEYDGRLYDSLRHFAKVDMSIAPGDYRLKIEWQNKIWFSEWFSVREYVSNIPKITYWHNRPITYTDRRKIRHIDYSDGFKFWWYVNHKVGGMKTEARFREKLNNGKNFIQRVDLEVFRRHFNVLKSDELMAFRLISGHHSVEVLTQNRRLIYVDKVEIDNRWRDDTYTEVDIAYYSDTVVSTTNITIDSSLKGEYSDDYSEDYNL